MPNKERPSEQEPAIVRVGVAGWDYRDWWGVVYPLPRPRGFDPLAYLAQYFDTIEINSTFYRPPVPKAAAGWARRVTHNARFKFTRSCGSASPTSGTRPGRPRTLST